MTSRERIPIQDSTPSGRRRSAHPKRRVGSMYEARRLEGAVKNRGIKRLGKQRRKPEHEAGNTE